MRAMRVTVCLLLLIVALAECSKEHAKYNAKRTEKAQIEYSEHGQPHPPRVKNRLDEFKNQPIDPKTVVIPKPPKASEQDVTNTVPIDMNVPPPPVNIDNWIFDHFIPFIKLNSNASIVALALIIIVSIVLWSTFLGKKSKPEKKVDTNSISESKEDSELVQEAPYKKIQSAGPVTTEDKSDKDKINNNDNNNNNNNNDDSNNNNGQVALLHQSNDLSLGVPLPMEIDEKEFAEKQAKIMKTMDALTDKMLNLAITPLDDKTAEERRLYVEELQITKDAITAVNQSHKHLMTPVKMGLKRAGTTIAIANLETKKERNKHKEAQLEASREKDRIETLSKQIDTVQKEYNSLTNRARYAIIIGWIFWKVKSFSPAEFTRFVNTYGAASSYYFEQPARSSFYWSPWSLVSSYMPNFSYFITFAVVILVVVIVILLTVATQGNAMIMQGVLVLAGIVFIWNLSEKWLAEMAFSCVRLTVCVLFHWCVTWLLFNVYKKFPYQSSMANMFYYAINFVWIVFGAFFLGIYVARTDYPNYIFAFEHDILRFFDKLSVFVLNSK